MKRKTLQKLVELDNQLAALKEDVLSYADEDLADSPGKDEWSVNQILMHLFLSEQLSEKYLRKKLSFQPELPEAGIKEILRGWLLKLFLVVPLAFKAPVGVDRPVLPEGENAQMLFERWEKQRQGLSSFFESLPESIFNKSLYRHPLVGKMTLYGMLNFFARHAERHIGQIDRILKDKASRS